MDNIIDSCSKGLPLGSLTSQWWANFYLNEFDHWIKEEKRMKYFFRYLDDITILSNSKEELHLLRKEIETKLTEIGLTLSRWQVFPTNVRGIDFVGYVSYTTHIKLRKSIKLRFIKMLIKRPNYKSIASYHGWLVHADTKNLVRKYLVEVE